MAHDSDHRLMDGSGFATNKIEQDKPFVQQPAQNQAIKKLAAVPPN